MISKNLGKAEAPRADVDAFMQAAVYRSIEARYKMAYEYYKEIAAQSKFKANPEPTPPEMIKKFTPQALKRLEKTIYLTFEGKIDSMIEIFMDYMHS